MRSALLLAVVSLTLCPAARAQMGSCIPSPDGLVSWWRGEGNALDSAGTNDGVMIDGITFTNAEVGKGIVFSGTGDDYIRLPNNLFPVPADGTANVAFSFELWFRTVSGGVILGQQDSEPFEPPASGSVPALYVGTNGLLHAALFWGGGTQLVSGPLVNDGRLPHVAVTYDGTTEWLYVDGVPRTNAPFVQQGYSTNYWYELGTGWTDTWPDTPGGWFPFTGTVDEVSLYNRALLPTEVADIFNVGSAGKCAPPAGPLLLHRYSFNEPARTAAVKDSVGAADGALVFASPTFPFTNGTPDGSTFDGSGMLDLAGNNGYVQLPSRLVSSLSNVTIEAWVTWNGPLGIAWQRILDFGFNDQGKDRAGVGTNYFILCAARGGSELYGFEETTVNPFGSVVDTNALVLNGFAALPTGQEEYLALSYDPPTGTARLFLNGVLVSAASGHLNPLSQIQDINDWLGRSQWFQDPFFNGRYDELRIWQGVLSPAQITAHYAAGPDQPLLVLRPRLHLSLEAHLMTLSWSTNNTAGFVLETATGPDALSWQLVTNRVLMLNNEYQVTVPVSPTAAFYRLRK